VPGRVQGRVVVAGLGAVAAAMAVSWQSFGGARASMDVTHVRLPAPASGIGPTAIYATVRNGTSTPDRLLSVRTDAGSPTPLGPELDLPPGRTVELDGEGRRMVLDRPTRVLHVGDVVSVTLTFATNPPITVHAPVVSP
jgi:copper(I)-binding protein